MAAPTITVVPHPTLLDWDDWRDIFIGFNAQLVNQVERGGDFASFADRLHLLAPNLPRHDAFAAWQDWVWAIKEALGV